MKRRIVIRFIVAVACAFLLAEVMHHRTDKHRNEGRDAYVKWATEFWDRYYSHPKPASLDRIGGVLLFGGAICAYELLAGGLSFLLTRRNRRGGGNNQPPNQASAESGQGVADGIRIARSCAG